MQSGQQEKRITHTTLRHTLRPNSRRQIAVAASVSLPTWHPRHWLHWSRHGDPIDGKDRRNCNWWGWVRGGSWEYIVPGSANLTKVAAILEMQSEGLQTSPLLGTIYSNLLRSSHPSSSNNHILARVTPIVCWLFVVFTAAFFIITAFFFFFLLLLRCWLQTSNLEFSQTFPCWRRCAAALGTGPSFFSSNNR